MEEQKQKKQIITISGRPGSGKSTAAKAVTEILGFEHFSSGDLFRNLGRERGVELLRANMSPKDSDVLDRLVDARLREIGQTQDRKVIDSRTAWHWIPGSFKVFLDLNLELAAKRILNETSEARNTSEDVHDDPSEYARILKRRLDSESERYKAKYNIDPYDLANYDLVIDTSQNSAPQVVEQIIAGFKDWLKN